MHDPDRLFRRVRDERGQLHLSRAALAYSPGQGVYRSAYKNALRLTRTEVNMAYRESDYHQWQQLDFIVGYEIRLSNNPNHCPMCAQLAGKYPKDFKFTGWHPHCRCRAIPITKTNEEFDDHLDKILNGEDPGNASSNAITSMPPNYTEWVNHNRDRILGGKSTPYFIRDNYKNGDLTKGLRFSIANKGREIFVPETELRRYERALDIEVDRSIFGYLENPVQMKTNDRSGAYFHIEKRFVNIPLDDARRRSKWKAESVVYHEFGHAIDWEHKLRQHPEVKRVMDTFREEYSKDGNRLFKDFDKKLWDLGTNAAGKSQYDRMYQIGALDDTIMSLNYNFGRGHSKNYFRQEGFSEAEFIAHAFENKFKGNPIFQEIAPELYEAMIKMLDTILPKQS